MLSIVYRMNNYKILSVLGEGQFASVWAARHVCTGKTVALKLIRIATNYRQSYENISTNFSIRRVILREIGTLCHLPLSTYIIRMREYFVYNLFIVIVFDKMECNLSDFCRNKILGATEIANIAMEIAYGLKHVHTNHLIHRDLKPANILISGRGQVKISDFGISRVVNEATHSFGNSSKDYTNAVVSRWYRAPELLTGSKTYSNSIDLWSLGCVLAELWLGNTLLCGKSDIEQLSLASNLYHPVSKFGHMEGNNYCNSDSPPVATLIRVLHRRITKTKSESCPQPLVELISGLLSWKPENRLPLLSFLEKIRNVWVPCLVL